MKNEIDKRIVILLLCSLGFDYSRFISTLGHCLEKKILWKFFFRMFFKNSVSCFSFKVFNYNKKSDRKCTVLLIYPLAE